MHTGDRHNFGRSVHINSSGWVCKPRPVQWEYLFLDGKSPLRRYLDQIGLTQYFANAEVIPDDQLSGWGGRVSRIQLDPLQNLTDDEKNQLGCAFGQLVALSLWFGLQDLHYENVFYGSFQGKVVVTPIDIECMFARLSLPSKSLLIPAVSKPQAYSAVTGIPSEASWKESLAAPAAFGFLQGLFQLQEHRGPINELMRNALRDMECTSRVLLRATSEYAAALRDKDLLDSSGFIPEEITQLQRGDIPYFFRILGSHDIFYFCDENWQRARVIGHSMPPDKYHRDLEEFFSSPSKDDLKLWLRAGSLQTASAFVSYGGSEAKTFSYRNLEVATFPKGASIKFGKFETSWTV